MAVLRRTSSTCRPIRFLRIRGRSRVASALARQIVQIEDAASDPTYMRTEAQRRIGFHSMLGVPMLREGEAIGVLTFWRNERASVRGKRSAARRLVRRCGGDCDRERAAVPRDPRKEPPARGRQPAQERVPRQHVARAAHAAECDHRLFRSAGRAHVRRAQRQAGRLPEGHPELGPAPVDADQRHPRPRQGRGGPHGARASRRSTFPRPSATR